MEIGNLNDIMSQEEVYADDELEQHLRSNYEFYFNVVNGRLFWRDANYGQYTEMADYDFNSILRNLKMQAIPCTKIQLIQILKSTFTLKVDPFIGYINTLPDWNGETDFIDEWAETIQATNQDLWKKCFKKWIVAVCASLIDPKTVNHVAPIFCGAQGLGKTRWISTMVPKSLKDYFFSGKINMTNKDSITQISECMLIDMDELENLGKKNIGDLKSLMTRETIRIRRPYGSVFEIMPRRASFIGSINHKEFLKDETGSRRFLCFEVTEINYEHNLSTENLFSQALALFNSGFQFWFDQEEIKEIQESNTQFNKSYMEEEILMNHFALCTVENATHFYSATKIAQVLKAREKLPVTHTSVQHIGKALAANKFIRLKKGGCYVWAVLDKRKNLKTVNNATDI